MKDTWLVQRLLTPLKKTGSPLDKAHRVFGGHALGLSEGAWDLLDPIFEIDYMGAAEYEFGLIPKTLNMLALDQKDLVTGCTVVRAGEIEDNWERGRYPRLVAAARKQKKKLPPPLPEKRDADVFILCRRHQLGEVVDRVHQLAARKIRCKEWTYLDRALDPITEHDHRYKGWLELDNGFFFFADRAMWESTCSLFGVSTSPLTVATEATPGAAP